MAGAMGHTNQQGQQFYLEVNGVPHMFSDHALPPTSPLLGSHTVPTHKRGPSPQTVPVGYSPLTKQPSFSAACPPHAMACPPGAALTRTPSFVAKIEKREKKLAKEEQKALRKCQLMEEKLRSSEHKMLTSPVDKNSYSYNIGLLLSGVPLLFAPLLRYSRIQFLQHKLQIRRAGLERELMLLNVELERVNRIVVEKSLQQQS